MNISYEISEIGDFVYTTPKGFLTLHDTVQYFDELARDPKLKSGAFEIVYFTHVTDFKLTYSEMEAIADSYQKAKNEQKILATIFVCETNLAFGIGRMLKTLHNFSNPDHIVILVKSPDAIEEEVNKIKSA